MFTDVFMLQVILVQNFSVERESYQQGIRRGASGGVSIQQAIRQGASGGVSIQQAIRQGASGNTVSRAPTAGGGLVGTLIYYFRTKKDYQKT